MAKKKTKKTPKRASRAAASATGDALRDAEKSSAARRAEIAVKRSVCWLRLLAKLDEIQVDAREYFKHGPRISEAEIDAELERHPKRYPHGRADVEWGLAHRDRLQLAGDLLQLWKRLPAIGVDKVGATGREAVAELLRALDALGTGDGVFEPTRDFTDLVAKAMRPRGRRRRVWRGELRTNAMSFEPKRDFSDLVAEAMRLAQAVAGIDAELARGFEEIPDPTALDVLRQLAKVPDSAKGVARALAKRPGDADPRKVERAIDRLKKLGFELPNVAGHGYVLSPSDRGRLTRIDRGI